MTAPLRWDQAGGDIGNPAALRAVIGGLQQARDALEASRIPAQIVATLAEVQYWLDLAMTLASGQRVIGIALGQILIDLVRPYLSDGAYILAHTNVADVIQQRGLRTLLQHGQDPFATAGDPPPYAGDVFTDPQSRLLAGVRGSFSFARQVRRVSSPLARNPVVQEILTTLAGEPQQNFDTWLQDFLNAFYDEADPLRPVLYESTGPLTPGQRFEVGPPEFGGYIFTVETTDPTVLFRTLGQLRDLFRTSSPSFVNPISIIPLGEDEEYDWRRDLANFAMFRGPARERIRMVSSTPDFQRLSTADLMPLVDRFANLLNIAAGFVGPPLLVNVNLDSIIQSLTETYLRILRMLDLIISTLTQLQMLLSVPGVSMLRIPLSRASLDNFVADIYRASSTRDDLVRVEATPPLFREGAVDDPTVENPTELAIAGMPVAFANRAVDNFRRTWARGTLIRDRRVEQVHGSYVGRGTIMRRSEAQRIAAAVPEFRFGPVHNLLVGGLGVFYQRGPLSQFLDGLFNRSRRGGGTEEDPASPEDIVDELRQVQSALSSAVTASIPRLSAAPTAPAGSRASVAAARGPGRDSFRLDDQETDRFSDSGRAAGAEDGAAAAQLSSPLGVVSRPAVDTAVSGAGTGFRRWGAVAVDAASGADPGTDANVVVAGSWRRVGRMLPERPDLEVPAVTGDGPPLGAPGGPDDVPASGRVASRLWKHSAVSQVISVTGASLDGPVLTCPGFGPAFSMPDNPGAGDYLLAVDLRLRIEATAEEVRVRTSLVKVLGADRYLLSHCPPSPPLATLLGITVVERADNFHPADEYLEVDASGMSPDDVLAVSACGRKVPRPGFATAAAAEDDRIGVLSASIIVGTYVAATSPALPSSMTGPLGVLAGPVNSPTQSLSTSWATGSKVRSWSPDGEPSPSTDRRIAASQTPITQWRFSGNWASAMAVLPLAGGVVLGAGSPAVNALVYAPSNPATGNLSTLGAVVTVRVGGETTWSGPLGEALDVVPRTSHGFAAEDPVTVLQWKSSLPFDLAGATATVWLPSRDALTATPGALLAVVSAEVGVEVEEFRSSQTNQAAWERLPSTVTVGAVPPTPEAAVAAGAAHRHADRLWVPAGGLRGTDVFAGSPAGNGRRWSVCVRSPAHSASWPAGTHRVLTLQDSYVDVQIPQQGAPVFRLGVDESAVLFQEMEVPLRPQDYLHVGVRTGLADQGQYRWGLFLMVSDRTDPEDEDANVLWQAEVLSDETQSEPILSRACEGGSVLMGALYPLGEDPDVSGHPATSLVSSDATPALSHSSRSALSWVVYATRTVILED
jgi:hypothetical protein